MCEETFADVTRMQIRKYEYELYADGEKTIWNNKGELIEEVKA